jgi:hypothetical protein
MARLSFKEYLSEQWVDSVKGTWQTKKNADFDVFVNPTKNELMEIDSTHGFRVLLDIQTKKVYMAAGDVLHEDMFKQMKLLHGPITYADVISSNQTRYVTFSVDAYRGGKFSKLLSDTYRVDIPYSIRNVETARKGIQNLELVLKKDISFVSFEINFMGN